MRTNFWRGVLTGGIIGAMISMMAGETIRQEKKGILTYNPRQARSRAKKVLRGVSRSLNDMIK